MSWRGDDYPASTLEALSSRGVDLAGVHPVGAPGLRTWLLYEGARRQVVHRLDRPSHADVSPTTSQLPAEWRDARLFHLAPMPFEIQRDLVESLACREGAFVSVDPYILLRADTKGSWSTLAAQVDALFLSEDEMDLPGAAEEPRPVLRSLTHKRLRFVVFKRGARGGLLFNAREDRFVEWAARAGAIVDPTGAGDAFAAGFLAGWLRGDTPARALARGTVSASFAIEGWGPAALLAATPESAEKRLREWFGA